MIDSHVHLDHPAFAEDLDGVLAHAVEDGVSALMNVGFDRTSARTTADLVEKYPFFYGIVGTHPHDAVSHDEAFEDELAQYLDQPRILGIGEIGLDFYYDHSPRPVQREVFRQMLRLAGITDKPIVIHCRDAGDEVLDILTSNSKEYSGIFHAFSGDAVMTRRVLELGFYLGIGGVSTYKNSRLLEITRTVPLERLVLETDSPYLAPHPFRGRRNEPAFVRFVAEALARTHAVSPEEVIRRTTENFFAAMKTKRKTQPPPVYKIGNNVYIHTAEGAEPGQLAVLAQEVADGVGSVTEAVICGYTDPLEHLDQVTAIATRLKSRGIPVRLVAGVRGHAVATPEIMRALAGSVGAVSVRMYGCNAAQHEKAVMTGRGSAAFDSLVEFTKASLAAGIDTECQFVAVPKTKVELCRELAGKLGARFSVRTYRTL